MAEIVHRITVEGAAAAKEAIISTNKVVDTGTDKTKNWGDAFKSVSRDIDAVAGDSGAKFGRMASDLYGVKEALGAGGVMGAAAGVSAAVGLGVMAWDLWKEHAVRAGKEAEAAVKSVSGAFDISLSRGRQAAEYEEAVRSKGASIKESADYLRAESNAREIQIKLIKEEIKSRKEAQVVLDSSMRFGDSLEPKRKRALEIAELEASIVRAQREMDEVDNKFRLKSEVERKDAQTKQDEIDTAKKRAAAQEEYDELRADLKAALALRAADKKKAKEDEAADDKKQAAENLAISEEENKRGRIAQATADQSMATEDLKHKKEELAIATREQANAENLATQQIGYATTAMYAQSAAMMVAQPIINEMLSTEREMLMLNRDTFQEYRQQDWHALIAAKVQAIMAGIAVEATGKSIMEAAEGAAAIATGLGMLALGMPNGAGMIAAGAGHLAAASAFASIAGASAGGAVVVGSTRGEGGLFKTGDEKKKDGMGGAAANPSFGRGSGSGGQGGNGGQQNTYVQLVMMPGAFLADTREGIGIVNGMVASGQQDEFLQRSNDRRP